MLKVRFHPLYIGFFLVIAAINLMTVVRGPEPGSPPVPFALLAFAGCVLVGVRALCRPYFTVEPGAVTVPGLLGVRGRRFAMTGAERLTVDGGRLLIAGDGRDERLPVARFLARPADWRAVAAWTARQGVSPE